MFVTNTRCRREPSGRLVCYSPLTDGTAIRACWWDDWVQPVLDEFERVTAEAYQAWLEREFGYILSR